MSVVYFIFQQTMLFTIPLMIVALGGMFSERSGVVNIALEGIMTMGAFTGILFLNMTGGKMGGQFQLALAILISTATGAAFAFFHAYASINMKANQTISGTALNMFAPAFAIFVARVIQGVQNTYITTYLGILILIASTLVLYRTRFGLRLRSCGEHPQAADAAGINVYRMQYAGVLISGVLGGLGGLVFVVPTSTNFNADVAGYGFLALAVLIFGQWKPMRIMWASLFFGLMKAVAAAYSGIPFLAATGIPSYVYKMIPYLATLIVLIFTSRNSQAPRASGVPYDKGQR